MTDNTKYTSDPVLLEAFDKADQALEKIHAALDNDIRAFGGNPDTPLITIPNKPIVFPEDVAAPFRPEP